MSEHRACVRDVSWHPFEHRLLSSSVRFLRSMCPVCAPLPGGAMSVVSFVNYVECVRARARARGGVVVLVFVVV